jgi:hypothetical protein
VKLDHFLKNMAEELLNNEGIKNFRIIASNFCRNIGGLRTLVHRFSAMGSRAQGRAECCVKCMWTHTSQ